MKLASGKILGPERLPCDYFEAKPFMTWIVSCRYCFCYCDAPGPRSDRYFSLRDVTSNITENKYEFILFLKSVFTCFEIFIDRYFSFLFQSNQWHSHCKGEWNHPLDSHRTSLIGTK